MCGPKNKGQNSLCVTEVQLIITWVRITLQYIHESLNLSEQIEYNISILCKNA